MNNLSHFWAEGAVSLLGTRLVCINGVGIFQLRFEYLYRTYTGSFL